MSENTAKTAAAVIELARQLKETRLHDYFPIGWSFRAIFDDDDGLDFRFIFVENLFEILVHVDLPHDNSVEAFKECVDEAYAKLEDRWYLDYAVLDEQGYNSPGEKMAALHAIAGHFPPHLNPSNFDLDEALGWWHFVRDIETDAMEAGDEYWINGKLLRVVPTP